MTDVTRSLPTSTAERYRARWTRPSWHLARRPWSRPRRAARTGQPDPRPPAQGWVDDHPASLALCPAAAQVLVAWPVACSAAQSGADVAGIHEHRDPPGEARRLRPLVGRLLELPDLFLSPGDQCRDHRHRSRAHPRHASRQLRYDPGRTP